MIELGSHRLSYSFPGGRDRMAHLASLFRRAPTAVVIARRWLLHSRPSSSCLSADGADERRVTLKLIHSSYPAERR
jgi:hypothetical protein